MLLYEKLKKGDKYMQIAKKIFLNNLEIMKKVLDLGEFKFGKNTQGYKFYKSQVMKYFYSGLKNLFESMKNEKILKICDCQANLKQGYSLCKSCQGSGYRNNENEPETQEVKNNLKGGE